MNDLDEERAAARTAAEAAEDQAAHEGLREHYPPDGREDPFAWRDQLYDRVRDDFDGPFRPANYLEVEKYALIRTQAHHLAVKLIELTPVPCRELSTALTKLEECVMHANAGIARHTPAAAGSG